MKRTEISDLGEFGLINKINNKVVTKNVSTIKGISDDAAVIDVGSQYLLVSTDTLVENIHFDLAYTPLKHLGYKSVAVNVSDIAAMNGKASQITVSIALSNRFSVEAVEELYEGINLACEAYGVDLVGGDTTASTSGLIITITALGFVERDKVVYRNTAKANDLICVSGELGASFMGLKVLEREKSIYLESPEIQPELTNYEHIVGKLLKPEARVDIVETLEKIKVVPTSMIDISDGLASEIKHICSQSDKGAKIFAEKVPIHDLTYSTAEAFNINPLTCALNGGEDYELLFTISQEDYEKVSIIPQISIIGHITEKDKGIYLVPQNGAEVEMKAQGWVHF
jgi:thiamine-monophosphate kinase